MEGKCKPYEETWRQVLTVSGVVGNGGIKMKLGGGKPTTSNQVLSSA